MTLQSDAVTTTVEALRNAGRITPSDDALVAAIEGVAALIDSGANDAGMWREYRMMLKQLAEVGSVDDDSDDLDALLDAFRSSPQVGDGAKRPPNPRG